MNREIISIVPDGEYAVGNPYSALAASYDDFHTGTLRIQPPCWHSDATLELLQGDSGVTLFGQIQGQEATIYDFSVDDSDFPNNNGDPMTLKEKLACSVRKDILNRLGMIANPALVGFESHLER